MTTEVRPWLGRDESAVTRVTTVVRPWLGRDESPPTSGASPIVQEIVALTCEVGGFPSEPRTDVRWSRSIPLRQFRTCPAFFLFRFLCPTAAWWTLGTSLRSMPNLLKSRNDRGARQLRIFSQLSLGDLGRRVKAQPARLRRCLANRSSSQSDAARTCKIASAPSGSFQNISVPLTR